MFSEMEKELSAQEMVNVGVVGKVMQVPVLIRKRVQGGASENRIVLRTGITNQLHELHF